MKGKLTTNKNVILVVNEAKEYICKFKVLYSKLRMNVLTKLFSNVCLKLP